MTDFALEPKALRKVYEEWCVKAGEVILGSRVTHSSGSYATKMNASFGIVSLTTKHGVRSVLDAQGSQSFFSGEQGVAIDVLNPVDKETVRVIERWRFSFTPPSSQGEYSAIKDKTIMRRLATGIRSLLSYSRLLPAYSVFRLAHVDKMKQQTIPHTHTIRMDTDAVFNNNPIPGCKDEEFICFASSVGTLRLLVSHVQNPHGLQHADGSTKQASLTEELKFEEGYVEKKVEDSERKRWGSEGTSQCSTSPDNTVLFPPSSTPPFGSSASARQRSFRQSVEEASRSMARPDSVSSPSIVDGSVQGLGGSSPSTPRGGRPQCADLADIWAIPGRGNETRNLGAPPRPRKLGSEESSDGAEICIFGLESDDEGRTETTVGRMNDDTNAAGPNPNTPPLDNDLFPVVSPSIPGPRTMYFSMSDSSAAFLDFQDDHDKDDHDFDRG